MPLPGMSVAPDAVTTVEAVVFQVSEPPTTLVGSVGAVRSIFTVLTAVGVAGAHADTLPAASTLRNCTSVVPSAVTVATAPEVAAGQLAPPFTDVRYWEPANP